MYYVGLDVHESRSSIEILDCNGKPFKRTEVKGRWPLLIEELKKALKPFAICYEASCGYGHLYEQFSKLAQQARGLRPKFRRRTFVARRSEWGRHRTS